jgi:hypothetical protein
LSGGDSRACSSEKDISTTCNTCMRALEYRSACIVSPKQKNIVQAASHIGHRYDHQRSRDNKCIPERGAEI